MRTIVIDRAPSEGDPKSPVIAADLAIASLGAPLRAMATVEDAIRQAFAGAFRNAQARARDCDEAEPSRVRSGSVVVEARWTARRAYEFAVLFDLTPEDADRFHFRVASKVQPHRPLQSFEAFSHGSDKAHALAVLAASLSAQGIDTVSVASPNR